MPSFEFTSPEGKRFTVDGPPGATTKQAFDILQQHLGANPFEDLVPKSRKGMSMIFRRRRGRKLLLVCLTIFPRQIHSKIWFRRTSASFPTN
jgi:hypothetical protein